MRAFSFILICPFAAMAFAPQRFLRPLSSAFENLSGGDAAETNNIDISHAKYCADHFGECSLEEMGRIRDSLHQERISHLFSNSDGIRNPQGLEEDLEHKLLESDLTLQMSLLKDKLATEHMQEESIQSYNGVNPYSGTMNLPVLDGTLDEESSEAFMICLAIAALALLPQIF